MAYELKTKENDASVKDFIESLETEQQRIDCKTILDLMVKISGCKPKMWGTNIIGFDHYDYKYASGTTGKWFRTGFAPRKQYISIYIMPGYSDHSSLLEKLGKHKIGKSCLNIKTLEDIDIKVLEDIIKKGLKEMSKLYKK
jgi:hypothetical protein